jgi:hypothetical protein
LEEEIRRFEFLYVHHRGRKTFQKLGKTTRKIRWSRRIKGTSHHSSEISLKGIQLKMILECQKRWEQGQGRNLLNVGVVREMTCIEIALIEMKE